MRILLIGGGKSGKSTLAQRLAAALSGNAPRYYWATMTPHDDEDRARIRRHVADRAGMGFVTVERSFDLPGGLGEIDRDGTVLFCHYGASLTDVPEDCAAIQSLLEEMELTPGQEPEEDELPYEELQTAVAAESRPRSRHGRERPETTDEFRPIRPVRAYPESDLEKTSMFGLFDDPYDDK